MDYNIILVCQWGASTGMLVEKMRESANKKNIEAVINAYSEANLDDYINDVDIVLLAPQVRFKKDAFEEKYKANKVPFLIIETADYGMLNGEKVLDSAIKKIEEERR